MSLLKIQFSEWWTLRSSLLVSDADIKENTLFGTS